ncbi:GerMN domain-containing protein [Micromonospora sp. WMMD1102]|uniref:GerMN domain-containing protein n=1 Tax=Micromonospora sp. WMMD1102 TaxID=3016105 RepID=UPI00241533A2|nr:GerMN domain-containing protein [Micromonospora sp. WMMD1102]MDG4788212.1 GerMN domain-containing protein [Micromonospora sp. WMMD1102]
MTAERLSGDEETLRRVLAAEADRIEPGPDALAGIQRRIRAGDGGARRRWRRPGRWHRPEWSAPRRRWGGWSPLAAGAVTVATLGVAAAVVGLAGTVVPTPSDRARPHPGAVGPSPSVSVAPSPGDPHPGPTPPDGAVAPSAGAGTGTPAPGTGTAALPVYYLGGDPARPRLYREFHRLWLHDGSARDRITAALRNLLDGPLGMDPDYRNPWPEGTDLRAVTVAGGIATVDLGGAARDVDDVDEVTARLAVQQLVWTVTAAPGVTGLRLRLDGSAVDRLWGGVDITGVLRRAPATEVLAPVWLIAPQHGDTVGRSFQVHLAGMLPEATAQLRIQRGSRIVRDQFVTLSAAGPAQGEAKITVTLPPGRYTLTGYAISLADGTAQFLDDHTVTVR